MNVQRKTEIAAYESAKKGHEAALAEHEKQLEWRDNEQKKMDEQHEAIVAEGKELTDRFEKIHKKMLGEHEEQVERVKKVKAEITARNKKLTTKAKAAMKLTTIMEPSDVQDPEPPLDPPVIEIPEKQELPEIPAPTELFTEPDSYSVKEVRTEQIVSTVHGGARALAGSYILTNTRTKEKIIVQKSDLDHQYQEVK